MLKFLFWVIAVPLFVFVVVFAASNPQPITLDLWPFAQLDAPLYSVGLIGAFVGFVLGAIIGWAQASGARGRVRDLMRDLESERREAVQLRERVAKLESTEQQATIPVQPAAAI